MPRSLGIVGGNFGRSLAKMCSKHSVLVYDVDKEKSDVRDIEDLYDACSKVVVAVPPESHYFATMHALRHGCDVLVLKPFAQSEHEIHSMLHAANSRRRVLKAGYNQRFRKSWAARNYCPMVSGNFEWKRYTSTPPEFPYSIRQDLGSHLVDLAMWMTYGCVKPLSTNSTSCTYDQSFSMYLANSSLASRFKNIVVSAQVQPLCRCPVLIRGHDDTDILALSATLSDGTELSEREIGCVDKWNDKYTFSDMIDDFIAATESDNEDYLVASHRLLNW